MYSNKTVAAVIPAYNEEASITQVVSELTAQRGSQNGPLIDDIVVCDNASTDRTAELARQAGARVVYEPQRGYGAACLKAIQALKNPDIVLFVDADRSCLANEAFLLLNPLSKGADLVIGSRALGLQEAGALTPHQRLGNRLASLTINALWGRRVTDLGPYRAICYRALEQLQMEDSAYGWTVEMQVKAIQAGLKMVEVPVTSTRRLGESKISGTLTGTIGACRGIFGTIFKLWRQEENRSVAGEHLP